MKTFPGESLQTWTTKTYFSFNKKALYIHVYTKSVFQIKALQKTTKTAYKTISDTKLHRGLNRAWPPAPCQTKINQIKTIVFQNCVKHNQPISWNIPEMVAFGKLQCLAINPTISPTSRKTHLLLLTSHQLDWKGPRTRNFSENTTSS